VRSYVRGGGELLLINGGGNIYQVGYDGNQNVGVLIKASDGSISAAYDYDPFGQTLKAVGEFADQNPIRFSNQYTDTETGLIYYGYRFYNPQIGRWIGRDPSEFAGGVNLYSFVSNDSVDGIDILGLWKRVDEWSGLRGNYSGSVEAECGDNLTSLAVKITGYASDWTYLGIPEAVEPRQNVNIGPLLSRFEERLRSNVLNASYRFQAQGFPDRTHPATEVNDNAAGIETFFRPNNIYVGCQVATYVVEAKGLIDTLRRGEYDRLGYTITSSFGQGRIIKAQNADIRSMKVGDFGWVQSYSDIASDPIWQGENIIKTGDNLYWAFPFSMGREGIPMDEIERELQAGYERVKGRRRSDSLPGLQKNTAFLDVARIGMDVFRLRGGKE